MTLVTLILAESARKKSKYTNRLRLIIAGIAFLAFLLNGKRGTLVWCIVAIILTWFVSTEQKSKFVTRLIIIACVSVVLLQFAVENIPSLNFIVERFSELGSDNSSTDRFAMWGLAILNFIKSPLLGIGFLNFREQYSTNLAAQFIRDLTDIYRIDVWMHIMYIFRFCAKWVLLDLYYILVPLFFYLSIRLKHLNISQRHKSISISMLQCCHSVFRFFICYTVCLETVFMI